MLADEECSRALFALAAVKAARDEQVWQLLAYLYLCVEYCRLFFSQTQVQAESKRLSRESFKGGLLSQIADRAALRSAFAAEPAAERAAREGDVLRRRLAVEDARVRKLAEARAAGISEKALRAAGLLA